MQWKLYGTLSRDTYTSARTVIQWRQSIFGAGEIFIWRQTDTFIFPLFFRGTSPSLTPWIDATALVTCRTYNTLNNQRDGQALHGDSTDRRRTPVGIVAGSSNWETVGTVGDVK